jgi:hypothetical protein
MVDLALLQSISYMAGALGVCIAAVYYVFVMRTTLQTRQAQLYMALIDNWNTKEFSNMRYDSYRMDWTDLDDYTKKYNPNNNVDLYASYNTFGRAILGLGELRKKRLIDIAFLDGMMMADTLRWWAHFGSLEKERWRRGLPGWENLVPFVMEVIEYHRKNSPWDFNEDGTWKRPASSKPWVKPEEMRLLQEKLNIK